MTFVPIYLPDGEQFTVEWYISDGKATGVESIRESWVPHRVGPTRDTGFGRWTPKQMAVVVGKNGPRPS